MGWIIKCFSSLEFFVVDNKLDIERWDYKEFDKNKLLDSYF